VVVNLLDQTGREAALGEAFNQHILELSYLRYFPFDFHANCKGKRYDQISKLVDSLSPDLQRVGFCWLDKNGAMVRAQKGVVRVNCVDCLDRTNVVMVRNSLFKIMVCLECNFPIDRCCTSFKTGHY
jgi:hypothetical protein